MKTPCAENDKAKVKPKPRGPACYENWKAFLADRPRIGVYEVAFYADGTCSPQKPGERYRGEYGPYRLLKMVCERAQYGVPWPAIVFRFQYFLERPSRDEVLRRMRFTDDRLYHGGALEDEIAALLSLSLGMRLKAGGISRSFQSEDEPLGSPIYPAIPVLLPNRQAPVIPRASEAHSLEDESLLSSLRSLTPGDAAALVRAARLYQDALWIAESQPALSWLMFASAVETAANYWRSSEETPRQRLQASNRKLDELLVTVGGEAHADKVAKMIADSLGSTRKFKDFIVDFLPAEPSKRPDIWQLSWDKKDMRVSLGKIYDHRSRALHGGTPFPAPMCRPPMPSGSGVAVEVPEGEARMEMGGSWRKDDLPMHIHTFEYIVQGALCNWWKQMGDDGRDTAEACPERSRRGGCAT